MKILAISLLSAVCAIATVSAKDDVDIAVTELPKVVTDAISKAHPNSTLLSAEKDLKAGGEVEHYEVKIRDGQAQKELTVLPDGVIQKTEND